MIKREWRNLSIKMSLTGISIKPQIPYHLQIVPAVPSQGCEIIPDFPLETFEKCHFEERKPAPDVISRSASDEKS
ncbi:MAG: hypothetical protein LC132_08905 [Burkholderiales bacterium]|nr:hypothetical protein [Burkholderiales bacterium]